MKESGYYLLLMNDYSRARREYEEKLTTYKECLNKVESMYENLSGASSNIKACESSFLSGGYVVGGQPYGNGQINQLYSSLENDIETLSGIISKTTLKIEEFNQNIKKYQQLYNETEFNYKKALAEEGS